MSEKEQLIELQDKYDKFVRLVHKMREFQFKSKYGIKDDISQMKALEVRVDDIVKKKIREQNQPRRIFGSR